MKDTFLNMFCICITLSAILVSIVCFRININLGLLSVAFWLFVYSCGAYSVHKDNERNNKQ